MPKPLATIGAGMTERTVVKLDPMKSDELDVLIAAARETLDRTSFQGLSQKLTAFAVRILARADLPSDAGGIYALDDDGRWRKGEGEFGPGTEVSEDSLPLSVIVQACGFAHDTAEGYAADALMLLRQAQSQLGAGSMDEAMATAFNLGALLTEASMKDIFEPDFMTGEKVRAAGRRAHERTYGTEEEKAAEWAKYVAAFDAEMSKRPNKRYRSKAYQFVAEQFAVHPITIRRAVERRDRKSF